MLSDRKKTPAAHSTWLIPAAQYVRMSTEDQQYSLANQEDVIADYARKHGFEVVTTYSDPGRSGVSIKSRKGLRQLLSDVIGSKAQFQAILVYDVSRRGRFQDPDESAHYEFLCRSARIPVHYCAEQFNNDGTVTSSIMKTLKRTMAAEYINPKSLRAVFSSSQTHPIHTQSTCIPGTCSSVDRNTPVVGKLTLQSGQAEPARSPQKHSVRTQQSASRRSRAEQSIPKKRTECRTAFDLGSLPRTRKRSAQGSMALKIFG